MPTCRWPAWPLCLLVVLLLAGRAVRAGSICCSGGAPPKENTLREDALDAGVILVGKLLRTDPVAGTTTLEVEEVLRADSHFGGKKQVEVPRLVPFDPADPPRMLVLFQDGRLSPIRDVEVRTASLVPYFRGLLDRKPGIDVLHYCGRHLDSDDRHVRADAYDEFAKATDQDIGAAASELNADRLRRLLKDSLTPADRKGLFAFLLACSGTDEDLAYVRSLAEQDGNSKTVTGALVGCIQATGNWDLAREIAGRKEASTEQRTAVLDALRVFHNWKPDETRRQVGEVMAVLLDTDIADLAIEELRHWKQWEQAPEVLAQYQARKEQGPVMREAIVRYALDCPRPEARRFVEELETSDPKMLASVRRSLDPDDNGQPEPAQPAPRSNPGPTAASSAPPARQEPFNWSFIVLVLGSLAAAALAVYLVARPGRGAAGDR